jgi:hypothetical protein
MATVIKGFLIIAGNVLTIPLHSSPAIIYVVYFFDEWMFPYFQGKLGESCQSFQILNGETLLISLSC